MPASFDLTGRTALVTGGSRGIGREVVETLAQAGADVVIVSRKADACQRAAAEVTAATGRRAYPLPGNVSDWTECDRIADAAYRHVGRVGILVNNAGASLLYEDVTTIDEGM